MNALLALPIVLPLITAALCLIARRRARLQGAISMLGVLATSAATLALVVRVLGEGTAVTQLGDWRAPFGIVLVADRLSALMLLLPGVLGPLLLAQATLDLQRDAMLRGFHPLAQILLAGVAGAFLAGDLFNLYVWFEVLLVASFGLICLGRRRDQLVGAVKYVAMNLFASVLFLAAVGLLYGEAGTLNLADLRERAAASGRGLDPQATLLLVAFCVKAAVFPFSFWLPDSYPSLPPSFAALFSALLTKVGVYSLLRVFTLVFDTGRDLPPSLLALLAVLSMSVGVVGAAVQKEMGRILAFHSISQIGYMVLGLALKSELALAGAIVFVLHHAVVKSNLFLVSGLVQRLFGTSRLEPCGGAFLKRPDVAVIFLVSAFSLSGMPPLSGFVAKLALVRAGLQEGRYGLVAVALAVGLVTLFSMTKIWAAIFWRAETTRAPRPEAIPGALVVVPWLLAACALALGLAAGPLMEVALAAARELLDPRAYVGTVLGAP